MYIRRSRICPLQILRRGTHSETNTALRCVQEMGLGHVHVQFAVVVLSHGTIGWPPARRNTAQCDAPPSRVGCDWLNLVFGREHCLLVRTYGKYINADKQPSVLLSLLSAALFTKQHCFTKHSLATMCYYDYIRLQCGCRFWGARRKRCREDTTPECGIKRVYKHLYSPRGLCCKRHEPLIKLSSTSSEWLYRTLPPVRGCETADCILRAYHRPPHVFWTECATDSCHLHTGHRGKHGEFPFMSSIKQAQKHDENIRRVALQLQQLNLMILHEMGKRKQAESVVAARYDEKYGRKSIERGTASFPDPLRWHLRPKVQEETFS